MQEKRRDKRLDLVSELIIKRLDNAAGNSGEDKIKINVKDVSKGGIGFDCDVPLTIGSVYEMNLTLWTKEVIHAFVEIVRIVKNGNTFTYGGIFIGMPEMDMKRIEIYATFREADLN